MLNKCRCVGREKNMLNSALTKRHVLRTDGLFQVDGRNLQTFAMENIYSTVRMIVMSSVLPRTPARNM